LNLKALTKISSAKLASNNHYVLDENVLAQIEEKNLLEETAKMAAQDKQQETQEKRDQKVSQALQKYMQSSVSLTVPELRCLAVALTNQGDSPARKKKEELTEQLQREPRKSRLQGLIRQRQLTLDVAATQV
jgi:transcription initiation factor IIF auxiliary subunit